MIRQRVIVGIGEAVLCEYPDRVEAGGMAALCARHAARLGHRGVVISRAGQDQAAEELIRQLQAWSVNIDHLQSDPDLATGRVIVRSLAGRTTRSFTPKAAFDNLQWDSDLEDVAQQADAVVFGLVARRESQSQSIMNRFLAECLNAVRVFDMTNRATDRIDRLAARNGLDYAQVLVADSTALKALAPAWNGTHMRDAAIEILRGGKPALVVGIEARDGAELATMHTAQQSVAAKQPYPAAQHEAAIVGLVHGILSGWDSAKSLDLATRIADHAAAHPNEPAPTE